MRTKLLLDFCITMGLNTQMQGVEDNLGFKVATESQELYLESVFKHSPH